MYKSLKFTLVLLSKLEDKFINFVFFFLSFDECYNVLILSLRENFFQLIYLL